jgi:hypothetical protein
VGTPGSTPSEDDENVMPTLTVLTEGLEAMLN